MNKFRAAQLLGGFIAALTLVTGCSRPPQVAPDNRHLVESLRTAVSTRQTEWLEANAQQVEDQRKHEKMSDEEYAEFQSIISLARAGKWDAAQTEVIRLAKAQRPTADDLQRLEASKTKPGKR